MSACARAGAHFLRTARRYAAPRPTSGHPRYTHAHARRGRPRGGGALEPWYAAPHLLTGRIDDASGMRLEAIRQLDDFASRAPRDDPALAWARTWAAELQAALNAEKGDAR